MRTILICLLLTGCSSLPEDAILNGSPGQLDYGITIDLGIIEPIELKLWGKRTKNTKDSNN